MTSNLRLRPGGTFVCGGLAGLAIWSAASQLPPQIEAQSLPTPLSYTAAQAEQGQSAYVEHCASCHGQNMDDGAFAPPLKGVDFRQKWAGRAADALFTFTSTSMPPDRPGALGDARYADLLASSFRKTGPRRAHASCQPTPKR